MKQDTKAFDDEEIRILLIGSEAEIAQALRTTDQEFRKPVAAWIRRRFPGLSSTDLTETWAEVLANLFEAAQGQRFDPDPPLFSYLCTLAFRRASDRIRRRTSQDAALQAVASALRETKTGESWGRLDAAERKECMELIRQAIATLPRKQGIVWQTFCDGFPETKRMETLRKAVSEATGEEETLASVKRALQEGRKRVKEMLANKGYGFDERGDV